MYLHTYLSECKSLRFGPMTNFKIFIFSYKKSLFSIFRGITTHLFLNLFFINSSIQNNLFFQRLLFYPILLINFPFSYNHSCPVSRYLFIFSSPIYIILALYFGPFQWVSVIPRATTPPQLCNTGSSPSLVYSYIPNIKEATPWLYNARSSHSLVYCLRRSHSMVL